VATGAGDDTEAETATVIPIAAVCPISAKLKTADFRHWRIPCIFFFPISTYVPKEAAFHEFVTIFAELFSLYMKMHGAGTLIYVRPGSAWNTS
jgi:hypothetical protein